MEIVNRKALYEYFVLDKLECGIVLRGNEVKSIRYGSASINQAWVQVQNNTLVLRGMHITQWDKSNAFDVDEDREKILLAHKSEIRKLDEKCRLDGVTLIPLKVYFKDGRCKVEVGICKGKKTYDKRESLKERQVKRDIERESKCI